MNYQMLSWQRKEKLFSLRALAAAQFPQQLGTAIEDPNRSVAIFAQHAPGPNYFRPKAEYLARNGYATMNCQDYANWLHGKTRLDQPHVMLTFDDGMRRFKTITFPVLSEYGMKSVLFVNPGLVNIASDPKHVLHEVARKTVLDWSELRELHESGLVDIQSHGMWHNRVPINDSAIRHSQKPGDSITAYNDLLPEEKLVEALVSGAAKEQPIPRYECRPFFQWLPKREQSSIRAAYLKDLSTSKEQIEHNLPGHSVTAFAFPWWNGNKAAVEAAKKANYDLVFRGMSGIWGKQTREKIDPSNIGRMSFDWIACLSGENRTSVPQLIAELFSGKHKDDVL